MFMSKQIKVSATFMDRIIEIIDALLFRSENAVSYETLEDIESLVTLLDDEEYKRKIMDSVDAYNRVLVHRELDHRTSEGDWLDDPTNMDYPREL